MRRRFFLSDRKHCLAGFRVASVRDRGSSRYPARFVPEQEVNNTGDVGWVFVASALLRSGQRLLSQCELIWEHFLNLDIFL